MKKIQLMVIDPQNSFCKIVDPKEQQIVHDGELCVEGAWRDMERVAAMITRLDTKLADITITLDSHHWLHIAHPIWFRHKETQAQPVPFTQMREVQGAIIGSTFNIATGKWDDVGEYLTVRQSLYRRTVEYLKALAAGGRYPHMIWPPHCIIGTPGHNIVTPVLEALLTWEQKNIGMVNKVTKGSNMWVEHFSGVRAEVLDPNDPTTQLNTDVVNALMDADEILWAGEARSHCLANTFRDIANEFKDDAFVKKCILLTDGTSDVTGLEFLGKAFVDEMTKRGLRFVNTTDYLV